MDDIIAHLPQLFEESRRDQQIFYGLVINSMRGALRPSQVPRLNNPETIDRRWFINVARANQILS